MIHKLPNIKFERLSDATQLRNGDLQLANRVAETLHSRSLKGRRTAQKADTATRIVKHYCALISCFMQEFEANKYDLDYEMGCRIKEDIIRIHKREARMLSATHGHRKLEALMCTEMWILAEMNDGQKEIGDTPAITRTGSHDSLAVSQKWKDDLESDITQDLGPFGVGANGQIPNHTASLARNADSDSASWGHSLHADFAIDRFLEEIDDPWYLEHSMSRCSQSEHLNASHKNTELRFKEIGTSAVCTNDSHEELTETSLQDIPTLTHSSDSTTFVSARSVVHECAVNTYLIPLVEDELDKPLVVHDDQTYGDTAGQDDERLGSAGLYTGLRECSQPKAKWPTEKPIGRGKSEMYQQSAI